MKWESNVPGTNMGSVTPEEVQEFWSHVKSELALPREFEWTPAEPSICMPLTIRIRESLVGHYPWQAYQEVLHEAAHVEAGGHGQDFHRRFAQLVDQFLGGGA